ncbi:SGNH/GDSL hydrolase family protein [Mucilaginibacter sp. RS28]|uniref:SGNH/GDSL hydrolase family protein n=1 Tax=Mucilaginibacter straminoryzae TaxID=2932774 RepID=A0A9X2BF30_9SPHI|nr:SGNH/GDSL hydrolase family protein [Mucilaginibacter straminoryzae]MCJ8212088.1 SGNH/GDSL hydrolase family protein [Mucilaginibacter straminoryzae]
MKALTGLLIVVSGLSANSFFNMSEKQSAPAAHTTMSTDSSKTVSYLALGDSYTVGELVPQQESFPYQLAEQLKQKNIPVKEVKVVAKTGWTTGELEAGINQENLTHTYDVVTLLIGVNNQYRGLSRNEYRAEFVKLLNSAINFAGGIKKHVYVLSIPDWGVTPFAEGRDRQLISDQIEQFNQINADESEEAGVKYVNITDISLEAKSDASMSASDGLHPSGKMYGLWVKKLLPQVVKQFK